jgi:putative membrane protein
MFPLPSLKKNDAKARIVIYTVSVVVFIAVAVLTRVKLQVHLPFDVHVFALLNASINSIVAILLIAGLITVKRKHYLLHKKIMLAAIVLSVLFLVSYIAHHLLAGETKFGDIDHDGFLSQEEKLSVGSLRIVYYIILAFILFTAYRALTGDYEKHKKLTRITWPIWFYVAISGVLVYWMVQPYYS